MKSDWKELIAALKSHGVEFLVVGAHALAFHARPRFTEDLDVFLRKTDENALRLFAALHEFGLPVTQDAIDRLFKTDREMIVLGHESVAGCSPVPLGTQFRRKKMSARYPSNAPTPAAAPNVMM